jgi:dipeptidyl aminopeptidase/acylaminoacyl peptidase
VIRVAFRFLAVLTFCCCALALSAQPLSPHDITGIRLASDVRLSPDARRVAFVISEPAESGRAARRSGIWTVAADGSEPPRLQVSGGDDNSPRWSPDGKTLAFLSARGETPSGGGGPAEPTAARVAFLQVPASMTFSTLNGASVFSISLGRWSSNAGRSAALL